MKLGPPRVGGRKLVHKLPAGAMTRLDWWRSSSVRLWWGLGLEGEKQKRSMACIPF
jgi:hypothetical protein